MLHKAVDEYVDWENAAFSNKRKRGNKSVKTQLCRTTFNHLRAAKIKHVNNLVFNTKTTQHASTVTPKLE